jgi:hypothetical protein
MAKSFFFAQSRGFAYRPQALKSTYRTVCPNSVRFILGNPLKLARPEFLRPA